MQWALGCLGVIFVLFGGCVLFAGVVSLDGGPDIAVIMLPSGAAILGLSIWLFYKAATIRRPPPPGPVDDKPS